MLTTSQRISTLQDPLLSWECWEEYSELEPEHMSRSWMDLTIMVLKFLKCKWHKVGHGRPLVAWLFLGSVSVDVFRREMQMRTAKKSPKSERLWPPGPMGSSDGVRLRRRPGEGLTVLSRNDQAPKKTAEEILEHSKQQLSWWNFQCEHQCE